ncbi:membrane protein [Mycobacterium shigaense]|uniref:Membrane protein n=1 Tax=Mycobacterium shigaense TaxID=722731 RepID=A0A1Z4EPL8_9MYCO|nr:membrane protein [Mycobacterium shigaense]
MGRVSTPNPPEYPPGPPPEGWQPYGYGPQPGPQFPPPSSYPPPSGYRHQPGHSAPQPYPGFQPYGGHPGYAVDPYAPFGRDLATGLPLSDKSATTAGLLQLFFGSFGIGRFYIESTQIAAAQLGLGLLGIVFSVFCLLGVPVLLGSIIWGVVDAIMMLTGNVKDDEGRKLR